MTGAEPEELIILKEHFAGFRAFRNVKIQDDQEVCSPDDYDTESDE
jgi:hypothetical protein